MKWLWTALCRIRLEALQRHVPDLMRELSRVTGIAYQAN
jgi:hypothetical protein